METQAARKPMAATGGRSSCSQRFALELFLIIPDLFDLVFCLVLLSCEAENLEGGSALSSPRRPLSHSLVVAAATKRAFMSLC